MVVLLVTQFSVCALYMTKFGRFAANKCAETASKAKNIVTNV